MVGFGLCLFVETGGEIAFLADIKVPFLEMVSRGC